MAVGVEEYHAIVTALEGGTQAVYLKMREGFLCVSLPLYRAAKRPRGSRNATSWPRSVSKTLSQPGSKA